MEFCNLLADLTVIAKMSDTDFQAYWSGLGQAVRIAAVANAAPAGAGRTEINNVAASTERAWSPVSQRPAVGFGLQGKAR